MTFLVEMKPEREVEESRNLDLHFKSKVVQRTCSHLLSKGSNLALTCNRL